MFLESCTAALGESVPADGSAVLELLVKVDITGILELAKVGAEVSVRLIQQFLETARQGIQ